MMIFLQNKRLNQFVILLICMFPIVVSAQGIEEALLNTKNTVEAKKEAEPAAEPAAEPEESLGVPTFETAEPSVSLITNHKAPDEAAPYDYQRHSPTWSDSPFSRKIVEPPAPPAKETGPSPWEGWRLAAVDKFGDDYTVGLTNKKGEFRLLSVGDETDEGVKLTKVESNGIISETTIYLTGGGHSGPLSFDSKRLSSPVKGAPVPKKAPTKTTGKLPARPPGVTDAKAAEIKKQQEAARAKIREQMLKARSSRSSSNNDSKRRVTLPPPRK